MERAGTFGVIGGGLMGIDISRRLAAAGYKATIIEAASGIGGLTSSAEFGDYRWDKFYHIILPGDSNTIGLIEELGLGSELQWKESKTGFFIDNNYYSMSNTLEFIRFPALNLLDKFRLGLTILAGSYLQNYKRLETIPVTVWLRRWSGKNTFNKIWLPLLKSKLGEGYKLTSAAFICATIKRLYGARKRGSKKELFGYVKGGYAAVIEKIVSKLSEERISVICDFKITEIRQNANHSLTLTSSDGRTESFDHVISTLPSFLTASLCPELKDYEIARLKSIKYLGVICVSLLLKRHLTPFYVTNITDDRISFTGVIEMTSLVDPLTFGGSALVYLPKYLSSDDKMFELPDVEIKENFLSFLRLMQPDLTDSEILSCKVARARYVIALPEMGYSKNLPSVFTSIKNFFIINSSFITDGTLNVNETLKVSGKYMQELLIKLECEK
jgi:protoporphyrinogen oxidase